MVLRKLHWVSAPWLLRGIGRQAWECTCGKCGSDCQTAPVGKFRQAFGRSRRSTGRVGKCVWQGPGLTPCYAALYGLAIWNRPVITT
eukprot:366115-Chlamydomonas_euryale.AAC.2